MVSLLRLISGPYLRKHLLRALLTLAGIVLGVAVFLGVRAANASILLGFNEMVDKLAGRTALQITAGEVGFGEEILEKVQSADSVGVAAPVIEAVVSTGIPGAGSVLVIGVDMTGDRSLRSYDFEGDDDAVDDPLIFLARPDSVILSSDFALRHDLTIGSTLTIASTVGQKALTVRGIMKPTGLASAFGGNLAVMDIYAAQRMFGRGRTFDRIDIGLKEGASIDASLRELRQLLGPGFSVDRPTARGQQFESMLASYSKTMSLSSGFALFIGMFIIYNSFAVAVRQRRSEIGVLRAIGATRRQIQLLFLGESVALGVLGSAIGLVCGTLLARSVAAWLGAFIADMLRVADHTQATSSDPWTLATAFIVGVGTSVAAALMPAREASRVDPVLAMKKGESAASSAGRSWVQAALALAAILCSVWVLVRLSDTSMFYVGYASAIVAALLLVAPLSWLLALLIRPVLTLVRPVEGALAADSLIQTPHRTSTAIAALMLSLALAIAFGGVGLANYDSIVDWTNTALNPDLFVIPSQSLEARSIRFPVTMEKELAALRGVKQVQALRNARIVFRDQSTMLVAFDMKSIGETAQVRPVAGDATGMYLEAAAGKGLLVSDNLAQLRTLAIGDVLELSAPYGSLRLPIVGIIVDYSDQQGAIMMDRALFTKYWRDTSVDMFRVYVTRGASVASVRESILRRYAKQRQVFVLTNRELKDYIISIVNRWFSVTLAQVAVAVLIAILGIVNTLTVSVIDRRRELGVLQAVGALRGQVRRTIWIEALAVGFIGLCLGMALGAVNLYFLLEVVRRDVAGLHLDYVFPLGTALMLAPAILLAAFVAAIWPAETAVRGRLLEALEYE